MMVRDIPTRELAVMKSNLSNKLNNTMGYNRGRRSDHDEHRTTRND